jgi:Dehydratase family
VRDRRTHERNEGWPTALHVTPEAAVGGPIGLVRDGDEIVLDAITGTLDLLVDDQERFVGPMKLHLVPQHPFVAMSASTPSMSCKPTRAATWTSWSITANTSGPANFDCLLAGTPSPNVK